MKIKVVEKNTASGEVMVRREPTIEEMTARMFGFEKYWGNHESQVLVLFSFYDLGLCGCRIKRFKSNSYSRFSSNWIVHFNGSIKQIGGQIMSKIKDLASEIADAGDGNADFDLIQMLKDSGEA